MFSKLNVLISSFTLKHYNFIAGKPSTSFQTYFKEFEILIIFNFKNVF